MVGNHDFSHPTQKMQQFRIRFLLLVVLRYTTVIWCLADVGPGFAASEAGWQMECVCRVGLFGADKRGVIDPVFSRLWDLIASDTESAGR